MSLQRRNDASFKRRTESRREQAPNSNQSDSKGLTRLRSLDGLQYTTKGVESSRTISRHQRSESLPADNLPSFHTPDTTVKGATESCSTDSTIKALTAPSKNVLVRLRRSGSQTRGSRRATGARDTATTRKPSSWINVSVTVTYVPPEGEDDDLTGNALKPRNRNDDSDSRPVPPRSPNSGGHKAPELLECSEYDSDDTLLTPEASGPSSPDATIFDADALHPFPRQYSTCEQREVENNPTKSPQALTPAPPISSSRVPLEIRSRSSPGLLPHYGDAQHLSIISKGRFPDPLYVERILRRNSETNTNERRMQQPYECNRAGKWPVPPLEGSALLQKKEPSLERTSHVAKRVTQVEISPRPVVLKAQSAVISQDQYDEGGDLLPCPPSIKNYKEDVNTRSEDLKVVALATKAPSTSSEPNHELIKGRQKYTSHSPECYADGASTVGGVSLNRMTGFVTLEPSSQDSSGYGGGPSGGGRPPRRTDSNGPRRRSRAWRSAPRFHCVFYHPGHENETIECGNRKFYVSQLRRHHERHGFFYCTKCFLRFETREARADHSRGDFCMYRCVCEGCPNFGRIPQLDDRLLGCAHGRFSSQQDQWRYLYRIAHPEAPVPDSRPVDTPQLPLPHFEAVAYDQNTPDPLDSSRTYDIPYTRTEDLELTPPLGERGSSLSKLRAVTTDVSQLADILEPRLAYMDPFALQSIDLISDHFSLGLRQLEQFLHQHGMTAHPEMPRTPESPEGIPPAIMPPPNSDLLYPGFTRAQFFPTSGNLASRSNSSASSVPTTCSAPGLSSGAQITSAPRFENPASTGNGTPNKATHEAQQPMGANGHVQKMDESNMRPGNEATLAQDRGSPAFVDLTDS